jgi:hypothetical protein
MPAARRPLVLAVLVVGAFCTIAPSSARAQGPTSPAPSTTQALPVPPATPSAPSSASPPPTTDEEGRQTAQKDFAEGMRAYKAGDFTHAAESFEAAYKHKPHFSALWNAARARQKAGDLVHAANLYARYLHEAPPSSRDRDTAQASLKQIEPRLGQLEIHAPGFDAVTVDQEPAFGGNVYVNPGDHIVEAVKADAHVRESRSVEAGQVVSVALVVPPPSTPVVTKPTETTSEERHGWSPAVAYAMGGVTLAVTAVAIVSGVDTLRQRSSFDKDPTQDNLESGRSKQLRTNILFGVSGALAVGTGVVAAWLVDWHGSGGSNRIRAGVGLGSVTVAGSF